MKKRSTNKHMNKQTIKLNKPNIQITNQQIKKRPTNKKTQKTE